MARILDEQGQAAIARARHDIAYETLDTKAKLADAIGHGRAGRGWLDWPKCDLCGQEAMLLWQHQYGDCTHYESVFVCTACLSEAAREMNDKLWQYQYGEDGKQ